MPQLVLNGGRVPGDEGAQWEELRARLVAWQLHDEAGREGVRRLIELRARGRYGARSRQ